MSGTPAAQIAQVLRGYAFRYASEEDLQGGIADALAEFPAKREVILGPRDRVDFMVGDVAIEVKIKGGVSALTRQLLRYANHDQVKAIVVVTSREQYALQLPAQLNGKELQVVSLRGAFS